MKYKEEARFQKWDVILSIGLFIAVFAYILIKYFLIGSESTLDIYSLLFTISGLVVLSASLYILLKTHMSVKVNHKNVKINYSSLFNVSEKLKVKDIEECKMVTTPTGAQYNGWNVHFDESEKVFSTSGRNGVKLSLKGGDKVFIGSNQPDRLFEILSKIVGK